MENRLQYMSWVEAKEAFQRTKMAIIPTGSTEQHGPHNPLGADSLIAEYLAKRVAEKINVVVTPVIPVGFAHYHTGFEGTLSVNTEALASYYQGIADSLISYGITHIMFINGHGGNKATLFNVCRNLRIRGITAAYLQWWNIAGKLNKKWQLMVHGGRVETSLVMLATPGSVKLENAITPSNKKLTDKIDVRSGTSITFKEAEVDFYFMTKDLTDSGNLMTFDHFPDAEFTDYPADASIETGEEIANAVVDYFVAFAEEFKKIKFKPIKL